MKNPWQPIETVPKDGSYVLLFHPGENFEESITLVRYNPDYDVGGDYYAGADAVWRETLSGDPVERYLKRATHWAAAPAPPAKVESRVTEVCDVVAGLKGIESAMLSGETLCDEDREAVRLAILELGRMRRKG